MEEEPLSLLLSDVTKKFGSYTAVNHLNLEMEEGTIFGMLGANGAGKTTTFRMILGLLEPTSGTISWKKKNLHLKNSPFIGYLPEERGLYPKLKVAEQITYFGKLRGMNKGHIKKELRAWLERFHISEYENKKVEELSKGNQQKIQFIASVIHRPELLILDEPFSGLDPVNVELLKKAVCDLHAQGTTILFSSHRMEHVEELCKQLCILHHGQPIVYGNLKEIKRSFGKLNISIRADFDLSFLMDIPDITNCKWTNEGAIVQIKNERNARELYQLLGEKGFVRKFELEDPSLHDIFIEKVGSSNE